MTDPRIEMKSNSSCDVDGWGEGFAKRQHGNILDAGKIIPNG
jgi:hypothetical protein